MKLPVSSLQLPGRGLCGCGLRRSVAAAATEPVTKGGALWSVDGETRSPSDASRVCLRDFGTLRSAGASQAGEALSLRVRRVGQDEDSRAGEGVGARGGPNALWGCR